MLLTCTLYYDARPGYLIRPIRTVCNYRKCSFLTGLITSLTDLLQANHQGRIGTTKTKSTGSPVLRLQNSHFWTFTEGAKRRKHDPRVWSAGALHSLACDSFEYWPSPAFTKNTTVLQSALSPPWSLCSRNSSVPRPPKFFFHPHQEPVCRPVRRESAPALISAIFFYFHPGNHRKE